MADPNSNNKSPCWICLSDEGDLFASPCDCKDRWHHTACFAEYLEHADGCTVCACLYKQELTYCEFAKRLALGVLIMATGGGISGLTGCLVSRAIARACWGVDHIVKSFWVEVFYSLLLGHLLAWIPVTVLLYLCVYRPKYLKHRHELCGSPLHVLLLVLMGPYYPLYMDILLARKRFTIQPFL